LRPLREWIRKSKENTREKTFFRKPVKTGVPPSMGLNVESAGWPSQLGFS
jgi:hypothetical protein